MEYQTVFDLAEVGYKAWKFPLVGLIFVAVGGVLVARRKNLPGWWSKHPRASSAFAFYFFGFAVLWTLTASLSTYADYTTLSRARSNKNFRVAEGLVTNFFPMPAAGHANERFCVSGACFEYSDYVVTAGFNNAHGGPIYQRRQVRVTYVGDSIVKLEVAK